MLWGQFVCVLQGWVAEVEGHDCVVCPYHGWAFDGEGVLQDVPAAETQKEWPRKQLVQSYPVKEKVTDSPPAVGPCHGLLDSTCTIPAV